MIPVHVHHWCGHAESHEPHPWGGEVGLWCVGFGALSRLGGCARGQAGGCQDCARCAAKRYEREAPLREAGA